MVVVGTGSGSGTESYVTTVEKPKTSFFCFSPSESKERKEEKYRRMIAVNGIRLGPGPPAGITSHVLKNDAIEANESSLIDDVKALCSILAENCNGKYITCVPPEQYESAQGAIFEQRGFCLRCEPKKVSNNGKHDVGVFVSKGRIAKNGLVAIYPGTVYQPREKSFLQPKCNPFVYACTDSTLIDGNNRALSKITYRSCTLRDRLSPHLLSDMTWLTPLPANPLAIGQFIDDHSPNTMPNVYYQEINLPLEQFPMSLRRFVPNVPYSNVNGSKTLRMVLLVSSREIKEGEELFVDASEKHRFL